MGIVIDTLQQQADREAGAVAIIADRRLFLDATQTRLVQEGSIEARWQLASPGHRIPSTEVARLGLQLVDGKVVQVVAEESKVEAPTDDSHKAAIEDDESAKKASESDAEKSKALEEDKQRQPDENKGKGRGGRK